MDHLLIALTEPVIVALDLIALGVIVAGTLKAIVDALRFLFRHGDGHERRKIWIDYSHWLVGALTFQLAADIVESAIAPDWDSIGRLGAVAVIRTFLNYFLERDAQEVRERQRETS
ncbi:DUF1622 domain-containing protein [Lysobacter panacisoli]|uniref:DUF1622 domain-containing protein n=1 Tax=Lysobacter panacisoli TaxID=1255263 RepID=A0ABP9LB68_9GAMM|nr:DUF1622 domain-containing protein [Lysobacter panacisoli]